MYTLYFSEESQGGLSQEELTAAELRLETEDEARCSFR